MPTTVSAEDVEWRVDRDPRARALSDGGTWRDYPKENNTQSTTHPSPTTRPANWRGRRVVMARGIDSLTNPDPLAGGVDPDIACRFGELSNARRAGPQTAGRRPWVRLGATERNEN